MICYKNITIIIYQNYDAFYTELYNVTVCPGSSYPFYVVTYYTEWVTTSWTYSTLTGTLKRYKNNN